MTTLPSNGTVRPTLRLPKRLESAPTNQGTVAPPKLERANIIGPTGEAISPNQCDSIAMLMGNTDASPNPARLAPATTSAIVFAIRITKIPNDARTSPALASVVSRTRRRMTGATARPNNSAPQKNDGVNTQNVLEPASIRRA